MAYKGENSSSILFLVNETTKYGYENLLNCSIIPTVAVLIAFNIGRVISLLSVIFGIFGNLTLIIIIFRSSFSYFSYGLLLIFICSFDIICLILTIYYYLIQAKIILLTLPIITIYISLYHYSKIITNWLKVFLAIERFIAVKYWISHRYNINSNNAKRLNRSRQKRILFIIFLLLLFSLISQHPNFIPNRFISTYIDPAHLLIVNIPNPNFYYGKSIFNGVLFTIISYIIIDDFLPITILIIINTIILYELRHLPSLTSKKLIESIIILFFLTIFSIFIIPSSFLVVFHLYVNDKYINETIISVVFHTFQGLEMINHAITGYACFLSCHSLRNSLIQNIRIIFEKFQRKNHSLKSYTIELPTISQK